MVSAYYGTIRSDESCLRMSTFQVGLFGMEEF